MSDIRLWGTKGASDSGLGALFITEDFESQALDFSHTLSHASSWVHQQQGALYSSDVGLSCRLGMKTRAHQAPGLGP